ncbi:ran guanine nucleotide release factor [Latimeria chalumnae]|uniref:RAN guanine nucleotide release factor n=1 Tax=Latimeria chalumnae TaxID=7897 RepID=H3ADU3_LATCH|nr:PREDICTED: ran guanine nucleotide release factor [Latimeria chalumnae]|eukprot:XP_005999833.1 PREDICTED: ran guanine nucleotide release factor [Latimeria chalumnae]
METGGLQDQLLFGGSFSAVLPPNRKDISEFQDIPDNQEVFIHTRTDQSIIVELLEYQGHLADQDAARYHFEDIASSNDASGSEKSEVLSVELLPSDRLSFPECSSAWFLSGRQLVAKFNEQARNTVNVYLGLFRLPQYTTDILVTFNHPTVIGPLSSSSGSASVQGSFPTAAGEALEATPAWNLNHFQILLQTFRLLNPTVFG